MRKHSSQQRTIAPNIRLSFADLMCNQFSKYGKYVQGLAKRRSPGLVNFVTALAYHFYLALPAAFTLPGDHILA